MCSLSARLKPCPCYKTLDFYLVSLIPRSIIPWFARSLFPLSLCPFSLCPFSLFPSFLLSLFPSFPRILGRSFPGHLAQECLHRLRLTAKGDRLFGDSSHIPTRRGCCLFTFPPSPSDANHSIHRRVETSCPSPTYTKKDSRPELE
jgi:hypothetical protein